MPNNNPLGGAVASPDIDLTVYPDECDAFGHLNQASFLSLFERARWEMLARGPGMDVFTRAGTWPAVRKTTVDYHAGAFPGDVLRFSQNLVHHGRTSFTMRQTARRLSDDTLIATAEFVFVCIDREGKPVNVPAEVGRYMNARPSSSSETLRLHADQVVLCGLSLGGYVALEFARRYRTRLRGLILMSTRAEADTPEMRKAREAAMQVARDRGAAAIAQQMLPNLFSPGANDAMPQVVDRIRGMMEAAPVKGIIGALSAMRDRPDSTAGLADLEGLPTLVVVGESDQITGPAVARKISEGVPGAILSVIPGAGHLPPVEQPISTTRVLTEFLQSLP